MHKAYASEVATEPPYLLKGLIRRVGLTLVWGPQKSGTSFWTFDAVMHVALGWEYRERRVQPGPVVYIAAEGSTGLRARVEAPEIDARTAGQLVAIGALVVEQRFEVDGEVTSKQTFADFQQVAGVWWPGSVTT
ncbi:MAG: AAA family ATPase [Proteobacteria bacterium]|nr:AAA family ATPase [Pseudomonadota bacterium]